MKTSLSEFLHGIRNELPILFGVLPFGMVYGVSVAPALFFKSGSLDVSLSNIRLLRESSRYWSLGVQKTSC